MPTENIIQTTTVKEDPQFAAYRQALLADANALVKQRSAEPVLPPSFQVAGLSPQEMQAMDLQKAGIGSYLPYLQGAQDLVGLGAQTFGQARGQLQSAQDQLALRDGARNELDSGVASIRQAGSANFDPSSGTQFQNLQQQELGRSALENLGAGVTGIQQTGAARFDPSSGAQYRDLQQQELGRSALANLGAGVTGIQQAGAARFDPRSVSQYQNPYQQYVGDAINRQFDNTLNQQQAQATSVGALSGSRRAIMEAELEGQRARAIGESYAQDYGRAAQQAQQVFADQQSRGLAAGQNLSNIGFQQASAAGQDYSRAAQQAQQVFDAQQGRGMAAGQNLSNIGFQQASASGQDYARAAQQAQQVFDAQQGRGMSAGQNLSNIGFQRADATSGLAGGIAGLGQQLSGLGGVQAGLGQQLQGMQAGDVSQLMNLGTLQRGLGQSALDANRQSILQQQQYPYQQIQFLSDIYKGTPSNQQTVTATPTFSPSPFQQAAGLGIAGVSAYAGAKNANLF